MSADTEAIARLMVLIENEERRTAETNERIKRRFEDEKFHSSLRRHPYTVMAHLTVRDVRAALDNDEAALADYWEREAHMERLRAEREAR